MTPIAGIVAMLVGCAFVAHGVALDAKPVKRRTKKRRANCCMTSYSHALIADSNVQ